MSIVVLDGHTLNPGDISWQGFEQLGDFVCYDRTPEDRILTRAAGAQAIIVNKTPITAATMDALPELKYIGVIATGYNVVDVAAAQQRNIIVTNIPSYGTAAVAQFVFALLLETCHHVGDHAATVKAGRWSQSQDFCYWDYPLIELAGKTMGIIGFGHIGRATAKIASALGMQILACGRQDAPQPEDIPDGYAYVGLEQLLSQSDVISLHVPLFASTQGMINANSIAAMKTGVIVINTARGALVVEEDMATALDNGKVFAYAADVAAEEPIKPNNPLLAARHCILTPHIAWAAQETRRRLMGIAVNNLTAFMQGSPINVVNAG